MGSIGERLGGGETRRHGRRGSRKSGGGARAAVAAAAAAGAGGGVVSLVFLVVGGALGVPAVLVLFVAGSDGHRGSACRRRGGGGASNRGDGGGGARRGGGGGCRARLGGGEVGGALQQLRLDGGLVRADDGREDGDGRASLAAALGDPSERQQHHRVPQLLGLVAVHRGLERRVHRFDPRGRGVRHAAKGLGHVPEQLGVDLLEEAVELVVGVVQEDVGHDVAIHLSGSGGRKDSRGGGGGLGGRRPFGQSVRRLDHRGGRVPGRLVGPEVLLLEQRERAQVCVERPDQLGEAAQHRAGNELRGRGQVPLVELQRLGKVLVVRRRGRGGAAAAEEGSMSAPPPPPLPPLPSS